MSFGLGNYSCAQIIWPFWTVRNDKPSATDKCADMIHVLQQEFTSRFQLRNLEETLRFFLVTRWRNRRTCFRWISVINYWFTVSWKPKTCI
jgi:hypothetical protein